jgi:hypothetical protein|nr:MAG TPA: hypothetical protein [Caudoviricetes sp.]
MSKKKQIILFLTTGGRKYIDLTENVKYTDFPNIKFTKNGIIRYARTRYKLELGELYNKNYDNLGWGASHNLEEIIYDGRNENAVFDYVTGTNRIVVGHVQYRVGEFYVIVYGYDNNGELKFTSEKLGNLFSTSAGTYQEAISKWDVTLPEPYRIVIKTHGQTGDPNNSNAGGNNTIDIAQVKNVILGYKDD